MQSCVAAISRAAAVTSSRAGKSLVRRQWIPSSVSMSSQVAGRTSAPGPVQLKMEEKLTKNLKPVHLQIINESHMHSSYVSGAETHFKVVVVSSVFEGKPLLERHRMVNGVLEEELKHPVHALSIQSKTPQQWEGNPTVRPSPACRGGSKASTT